MRGLRSLLALVIAFGGLLAYIYFVDSKRPSSSEAVDKKEKAFTVEADKIEELMVRGTAGTETSLKKTAGAWQLTAPESAKADESEVSGITSNLSSLEVQRVVDENASNMKDFGLDPPRIDVGFKAAADKDFKHLFIGDKTGTGGDLYARFPDKRRVFLISSYLESTFNRSPFELRDKTILKFERDKIDGLDVTSGANTIQMVRTAGEWALARPVQARADYGTIEGLVSRLQSAQMKSIVASAATNLKQYGLDKPDVSVTVASGSSRAGLALGKPAADGNIYARDVSRPMVFAVEKSLLDDLKKPVDDYRRKDVFEFRSFNANKIEITRSNQTATFEKVKGSGKDAQDKWRQTAPSARDVDATKMDALLSKLSNLRVTSFAAPTTPTGLKAPLASVTTWFDDSKKQEQVTFGRNGSDTYSARKDEPGAGKLDSAEFDGAMKALDELK